MKDNVKKLARVLKLIDESDNQEHGTWGYEEKAQALMNDGWIHKEDAVKYVSVCPEGWCFKGKRKVEHRGIMEKCPACKGLGLVPLKEYT